ncbi:hypothetical protein [Streptomyces sp. SR27]|uniref:hypothetical protein n=1 Tax=Streptomyces sp. SR27 TaxID=3076630 RepID=UPI00295A5DAF|nr:hypothetical protein [Streptomyces sp. SR27]
MTPHSELRLLPWSGPDGKPCYLSTDDNNSHLSRLADSTEAIQVGLADNLLAHALVVLGDQNATPDELRVLSTNLVGALRDILRIAASRSRHLSVQRPSTER